MNVLFYSKLNKTWKKELSELKKQFKDANIFTEVNQDILVKADVIVGGLLSEKTIRKAVNLKLIIVPFAGVDHLPMDLLMERGIIAVNSHGNANAVAERALSMILALYGRIVSYHNDLKEGQWHGFWVGKGLNDTWESIRAKNCSIIGAGSIGRSLAAMLKSFDIRVCGYKRNIISGVPDPFDEIVYDLDEAIERSEIIVLALPSTKSTKGLFNSERLKRMSGKVIVNVGRGDLIDEEGLFNSLKNGILKGAAIDCWYNYPKNGDTFGFPSSFPIHNLPNVVLSPHVAGFTAGASKENILEASNNLKSFLLNHRTIRNIDLGSGY